MLGRTVHRAPWQLAGVDASVYTRNAAPDKEGAHCVELAEAAARDKDAAARDKEAAALPCARTRRELVSRYVAYGEREWVRLKVQLEASMFLCDYVHASGSHAVWHRFKRRMAVWQRHRHTLQVCSAPRASLSESLSLSGSVSRSRSLSVYVCLSLSCARSLSVSLSPSFSLTHTS